MEEVPDTSADLFTSDLYTGDSQTMNANGEKGTDSAAMKMPAQKCTEVKRKRRDHGEVKNAPVADRAGLLPVKNGSVVTVCVYKLRYFHCANVFVRIEWMEDRDTPRQDVKI